MSVVAVKKYKDRIEVAADSIIVAGTLKYEGTKLHKLTNGIIFGSSGTLEELEFIRDKLESQVLYDGCSTGAISYDCSWLRKCLHQWSKDWKEMDTRISNHHVIVIKDKTFVVAGLSARELETDEFFAVGAGQDFALTALHCGKSPKEAVALACKMSIYCMEPVIEHVVKLKGAKCKSK